MGLVSASHRAVPAGRGQPGRLQMAERTCGDAFGSRSSYLRRERHPVVQEFEVLPLARCL
jgi:hypothetical protein